MSVKSGRSTVTGTLAVLVLLVVGYMVFTSETPSDTPAVNEHDSRTVMRWEITAEHPAQVNVHSTSSVTGFKVEADTLMTGTLAADIALEKGEELVLTARGELPKVERRASVTCRILVNGKEMVKNTRVVRADTKVPGVMCVWTARG
jgi:hypothetical protein